MVMAATPGQMYSLRCRQSFLPDLLCSPATQPSASWAAGHPLVYLAAPGAPCLQCRVMPSAAATEMKHQGSGCLHVVQPKLDLLTPTMGQEYDIRLALPRSQEPWTKLLTA